MSNSKAQIFIFFCFSQNGNYFIFYIKEKDLGPEVCKPQFIKIKLWYILNYNGFI